MLGGQTAGTAGPGDGRNPPPNPKKANHTFATQDPYALARSKATTERIPFSRFTPEIQKKFLEFGRDHGMRPLAFYNDRAIFQSVMDGTERLSDKFSTSKLVGNFKEMMGDDTISKVGRTSDIYVFQANNLERFTREYQDKEGKPMDEARFTGPYQKTIGRNRIGDLVRILVPDSEAFQRLGKVHGYDFSNVERPLVVQFPRPIIQAGPGEVRDTENFSTEELELVRRASSPAGEQYRIFGAILKEESSAKIKGLEDGDILVVNVGKHALRFKPHGVPFDARELMRRFEKMLAHDRQGALKWLRQNAVVVGSDDVPQMEERIAKAIKNRASGLSLDATLSGLL